MNIKILYTVTFFPESRAIYEIMWKNVVERGRPQMSYNTASAFYMLHNQCHKQTLRIYNTNYFHTATIVSRTRLDVMLYVHCLS